jgi:hypothetical protein
MITTLFGSCRLGPFSLLLECTSINEDISHVHSTKEILQLIKILNGDIKIDEGITRYVFRTGVMKENTIKINENILSQFKDTELFIIEICSMKKYVYNEVYLHHLSVDKRWPEFSSKTPVEIRSNTKIEEQSENEIRNDINEIVNILSKNKIVFVSHILPKSDILTKRKKLINILEKIHSETELNFIFPTEVLVEGLVSEDLGHYNPKQTESILFPYYKKKLTEMGILK